MPRPRWTRRLLVALALAIGTAILYAPAAQHGFVNYDDGDYAYDNPHVTGGLSVATVKWAFTTGFAGNYHPLTWLSLATDGSRAAPADLAGAMHWTNIALHSVNVALLFLLLAVATGADAPAAVVAVLFAVHPVHVESVAWVAERKDVLCGLFYLSAMLAHVAIQRRGWRVSATTLLGAAALLSKPMAVSLPAALLLLDYWPMRRLTRRGLNTRARLSAARPVEAAGVHPGLSRRWRVIAQGYFVDQVPLLLLSAAFCCVTVAVQSAGGAVQSLADVSLAARAQNVPAAYARYLGKLVWPSGLSVFYPYRDTLPPAAVAASVLLLVGATAIAMWVGRRVPYLAFGWLWFLVTLLPVIGIVQVGYQSLADRYLYLPMIGPAVVVVWGTRDLLRRADRSRAAMRQHPRSPGCTSGASNRARLLGAAGWALALLVTVALVVTTRDQLRYWTDTRTLFNHSLEVAPDNAVAEAQLGWLDRTEGNLPAAERHYARAVQLVSRYGEAAFNLGNLLLPKDPRAAVRYYQMALRSMPNDARVENNLGVALLADPARATDAAVHFRAAIADAPAFADPHLNLGQLLRSSGHPAAARAQFEAALQIDPHSARARRALGRP